MEKVEDRIGRLRKQARRYLDSVKDPPPLKGPDINTIDTNIAVTDRISMLPDSVLVHILSLLPTTEDVLCMRLMSRTWHRIWSSFPVWEYSESLFGLSASNYGVDPPKVERMRELFMGFVHRSLVRQLQPGKFQADKFRLHMTFSHTFQPTSQVDEWMRLVVQIGVTELDLDIDLDLDHRYAHLVEHYELPRIVFSAKKLTVLKLRGSGLLLYPDLDVKCWPCLQELCLREAYIDRGMILKLKVCCPLIKNFALVDCLGLDRVELAGLMKLRKVQVIDKSRTIMEIEIDALSLETFCYGYGLESCQLSLTACENLKVLELENCFIGQNVLADLLSAFPALKKLFFHDNSVHSVTISGQQLEALQLGGFNLTEATINAPSLQSFKYASLKTPSWFSVDKSSLQKVTLTLFSSQSYCFAELQKYLGNFKQIKLLTLHVDSDTVACIPRGTDDISVLCDIQCVRLKISRQSFGGGNHVKRQRRYKAFLDGLFCTCRPQSLLLVSGWGSNNEFIEFLYDNLKHRVKREECCMSSDIRCWLHGLEGIHIEYSSGNASKGPLSYEDLLDLLPTIPGKYNVHFLFKW
ncbi:hypothetical protein Tsubulata_028089 [Turnera subulata]|uniref:F-box domain-containing protein n=1 Tax=Turnera subulata TaxID=218843 RepID=A0A9Q0JDF9_9ROSI|nr:hypothetical protein Tsubulata_028089 [Turnera subulata]